ncbi:MAG: P-loop containing nucleoside triphosphate hydrolase protein, partial [Olpidium bornovanus]
MPQPKKKGKAAKKKDGGGGAFAALAFEDDEVAAEEAAEKPASPEPEEPPSPEPEQAAAVLPAKKRGKAKKGKKGKADDELFPDDSAAAEQLIEASTTGEGDMDGENVEAGFGKKKKKGKKDTGRKAISVKNAFDILNAEGSTDDNVGSEGKEAEETVEALPENRPGIQSLSGDEGETLKSEIKGKKKPKESRESRKERLKKAKEADAAAAGKNEPEVLTGENAKYGNSGFERSQAAAYGYASGQPLGPEGTNPADAIAVTGNLVSAQNSRDLQVDKVTVQAFGKLLIKESELNLINGRRYGLIAPNGSGKSTLLHAIACGLMPMPRVLDVYLLDREYIPTETTGELTSLEAVLEIVEREKNHLGKEMEELLSDVHLHAVRIDAIQNRLTELEAEGADRRALSILKGLGFTEALISTKTKDLSGGWRMRISLARILFVRPTLIM